MRVVLFIYFKDMSNHYFDKIVGMMLSVHLCLI